MKTFNRASLPDVIKYNGKEWVIDPKNSARHSLRQLTDLKPYIKVKVLPRTLKSKTDLHGKPYQPTEHLYTIKPQ
jgi:hypothetical protein